MSFIFSDRTRKPDRTFLMKNVSNTPSLKDDFQVISQNHLLASINMKHNDKYNSKLSCHLLNSNKVQHLTHNPIYFFQFSLVFSQLFTPGCGHNDCAHCDAPPAPQAPPIPPPPTSSTQCQQPPPLPPKPPWMRQGVRSGVTRPRPQSYNESSSVASVSSETTETSEVETVIYSKNVRLDRTPCSQSEVQCNTLKPITILFDAHCCDLFQDDYVYP